jgi:segregation and condensation protein B
MEFDLKKTLEALLLSTAEPVSLKELVQVFTRHHSQTKETLEAEKASEEELAAIPVAVTQTQISSALAELMDLAEIEDKVYRIVEGPNGYQLVTAPQFAEYIRLLRGEPRPLRLSPAAMETLSIIAYRQPVIRAEIEAIRGVSVDGPLNRLIEMELAHVAGRAELPGRPIQYGTTDKFLEFVGIKAIDELPASDVLSNQQIDDWIRNDDESQMQFNDKDVGLSKESEMEKLLPGQQSIELDWQMENIESDAASNA